VDGAAENVATDDRVTRRRGHRAGSGDWLVELETAVGFGFVVVAEVLGEYGHEMSPRDDEEVVQAVLADGPNESLGERVGSRRGDRGSYGLDTDGASTESKAAVNLVSRSRTRNRKPYPPSSRSETKLRATWVTQGPLGWAVTPSRCTLRRSISMTKARRSGAA
jgi:hypothetical protein